MKRAYDGKPFAAALLACGLFVLPAPAMAQLGISASLSSEYWLRAFPVSNGNPAAILGLSYDHRSGLYGGATLIAEERSGGGVRLLGHMEYAGYARRVGGGVTLDGGIFNTNLERYNQGRSIPLHYVELYGGATWKGLSARAYYSPNYLRDGARTVYLDVNGAMRPRDRWRLFAHGGVLVPLNDTAGSRKRWDLRAGVAREFGRAEVSAAYVYTGPPPNVRPGLSVPDRGAVVISASYFF